jgi:hypothetical protein
MSSDNEKGIKCLINMKFIACRHVSQIGVCETKISCYVETVKFSFIVSNHVFSCQINFCDEKLE